MSLSERIASGKGVSSRRPMRSSPIDRGPHVGGVPRDHVRSPGQGGVQEESVHVVLLNSASTVAVSRGLASMIAENRPGFTGDSGMSGAVQTNPRALDGCQRTGRRNSLAIWPDSDLPC